MFLVGVGIRARRGLGRELSVELAERGITARQPRHAYELPREGVRRVEETPEFFLIAADGGALYLPKRALAGADQEDTMRKALIRIAPRRRQRRCGNGLRKVHHHRARQA